MLKIKDKDFINEAMAEYYIESESELADIPSSALKGTIAIMNAPGDFKVFMKDSEGNWNEL